MEGTAKARDVTLWFLLQELGVRRLKKIELLQISSASAEHTKWPHKNNVPHKEENHHAVLYLCQCYIYSLIFI